MADAPVLVTGATGIAGRHVLRALERQGIRALPVSREPHEGWARADLSRSSDVEALPEFSGVIHCAGLTPRGRVQGAAAFRQANLVTTMNLSAIVGRRGARFFVFVSTMGRADQPTRAGRLYVASKIAAERHLLKTRPSVVWIIRAASMYGEHDRGSTARLIRAIAARKFVLPGSGRQRKCLVYAGAMADAIATELAAGVPNGHRTENATDPVEYRLIDIIEAIERATERRCLRIAVPDRMVVPLLTLGRGMSVVMPGRGRAFFDAVQVALRSVRCEGPNLLSRHPDLTVPLAEGIRREVVWMREQGQL